MAQGYALRYYKSYDLNGHKVKLDIYKKYPAVEYAPAPMEIGRVLQGLSLDVQGEQDDIISPIVKTSLSMTFADAPGEEKGKKTGDWEEFYTPDSTGYKVLLYIDGALYWSGYVTPDSFEEDLDYHGSVTIVARDNIGHLQDFQFDAEGNHEAMISVRSLIDSAWSKVECLLSLSYASGSDVVWPTCEGYNALDCIVNIEAFAEKNWFEALEAVLDSFGLVLRYVGNNKAMVMPLRALPCLDKERLSLVEVKKVLLQATGHRMLTAACKSIVDNARILQKADPGQRPQQEAHAHRQHYQHIQDLLGGFGAMGDEVRHRITQKQADECGDQRVQDRLPQHAPVRTQSLQIGQGEHARGRIGQGIVTHHTQRDQGEGHHPQQVRCAEQYGFILLHPRHPPSARRTRQSRSCSRRTCQSIRSCA